MNTLNQIDFSFSILDENKFIDLILYGSDKFDDNNNHKISVPTIKFIKDWQKPSIIILLLIRSEYCVVYVSILGLLYFVLLFFIFSTTGILYISSRVLLHVFRFNVSFCVNNDLKKKFCGWSNVLMTQYDVWGNLGQYLIKKKINISINSLQILEDTKKQFIERIT